MSVQYSLEVHVSYSQAFRCLILAACEVGVELVTFCEVQEVTNDRNSLPKTLFVNFCVSERKDLGHQHCIKKF